MPDTVLAVRGVWKRYGLPLPRWLRSLEGSPDPARNGSNKHPWILREINFEVIRGETVAIVGTNGAAKSTLLKVLAGVTPPTRGRVERYGRLFPMIEITGGLHQELTGRENITLIGTIIGLSRSQLARAMPQIEDFTELGSWLDQPIRSYSNGMVARLGFGVGICVTSDIVLIDEALAVGDLAFQNKCLAHLKKMRERGAAILLVTHSLDTAQFIAQRGIVLENGQIVAAGSSVEALRAYEHLVFRRQTEHQSPDLTSEPSTVNARVSDSSGRSVREVEMGAPFGIEIECESSRPDGTIFSLAIVNQAGVTCVWNLSAEEGLTCPAALGRIVLRARYDDNRLASGYYRVDFAIQDAKSFEVVDQFSGVAGFSIAGPGRARGIVAMTPRWDLSPAQAARTH